jgi:sensor histidine kinase YesM/ligand-binding sensor domain-containing protein
LSFEDKSVRSVTSIKKKNDLLYVGTNKGLYLKKPSKNIYIPENFVALKNAYINHINVIKDEVWIGTNMGLFILKNGVLSKSNKTPSPNVGYIYLNDQGLAWICILDYGLLQIDPSSKFILKVIKDERIQKSITCIETNDYLYIGSLNQGLFQYNMCDNSLIASKDISNAILKIRTLKKDTWNNIWVGTSGSGLLKITNQEFRHYFPSHSKIYDNRIYTLSQKKDGTIATACGPHLLATFNQSNFIPLNDSISRNQKIKSLTYDTLGRLWVASEGNGVFVSDSQEVKHYCIANRNFEDDFVNQLICDQKNNIIWFACNSSGIVALENERFKKYNTTNGLRDNYISCIALDYKGNLWWGSKKGNVGYIDTKGRAHSIETLSEPIKTITCSDNGIIYFSITGEGVYSIKNFKVTKLLIDNKIYSSSIYSMIVDAEFHLWVGSENGVSKILLNKEGKAYDVIHYSKGDGFLGIENCHNSILKDRQNNIWFGTMNGLSMYSSENAYIQKSAPILHVKDAMLFYKPLEESKYKRKENHGYVLPYDQNHLSFSFDAVHTNYPDKIKYRYRLDGSDAHWSQWTQQDNVSYASLSPGKYSFSVQSSIDENVLSNTIQIPFIIEKPLWEKPWFRILSAVLLTMILLAIFKIREKNIKLKAAEKNKALQLQNNLLMLEQKALQLQMNPHFIFNALNSIQSVIVDNKVDKAREEIQNFALLMRSILNNSRKKTISLKEEITTIEKYLQLEQFCQKNQFDFHIEIAEDLDIDEMEIPSMLIQPYIENAVIHGIAHLKKPGKVFVSLSKTNEVLCVSIKDNGVGRIKAKELTIGQQKSHVSLGMEVTGERLKNLAKEGNIVSPEIIIDHQDEDGRPMGTEVKLKIPITTSY